MNNPTDIVIYAFLLVTLLASLKLVFTQDSEDRKLQKIIGGLSVFIVAIISKEQSVFIISLFIGGLIIASENFMIFLAAIMKTSSDRVADTVNALNTKKASKEEVAEKIKNEEALTLKVEQAALPELKESASEYVKERFAKVKKIEELVDIFFKEKFKGDYESHMKLVNNKGAVVVDGLIRSGGNIDKIVEIKFITEMSFPNIKYLVASFYKRLKSLGIRQKILFVLVSEKITEEIALKIKEENNLGKILLFFRYENGKITPVLLPDSF